MRQLIAGVLYIGFFLYRRIPLPKERMDTGRCTEFSQFHYEQWPQYLGSKILSAGLGSIIGAIFPLWLVVIGLFISKKITATIIGLLLGFSGVCVIFYDHLNDFWNPDFMKGIILSLIATWTWAFATLYTKKQAVHFNPYFSLGLQMVISGVCLFSFTHANGTAIQLSAIPWQSWASIAYLIVFGSLLAFICYLYALQNLPTEQASIYAYINPIVAVLCGWIVFEEKITPYIAIGGFVTLVGVYLVNKAFKAVPPPEQPETEGI
jgi:drug/metabolite transporter (DMT)-like permease